MFHAKTYIHIFTMLTLFSCTCSLAAMKKIKNHGLEITPKNPSGTNDIFFTKLKVFDAPFLKHYTPNSISLALDTKTIAFCDGNTIEIWDLNSELGQCLAIFDNGETKINYIVKLTNTSIAFIDNKGHIKQWDFMYKTQKKCAMRLMKNAIKKNFNAIKMQNLFLKIPKLKAAMLVDNNTIIKVWDTIHMQETQHLNCSQLLKNDSIVSVQYFEEENMLMVISKNGYIITWDNGHSRKNSFCDSNDAEEEDFSDTSAFTSCDDSDKRDTDDTCFFKNIKNDTEKNNFKAVDFVFDRNKIGSLCKELKKIVIS